jgi:hypothetical protein
LKKQFLENFLTPTIACAPNFIHETKYMSGKEGGKERRKEEWTTRLASLLHWILKVSIPPTAILARRIIFKIPWWFMFLVSWV